MTHAYKGHDYSELLRVLGLKPSLKIKQAREQVWLAVMAEDTASRTLECRAYLAAYMNNLTIKNEELGVLNALSHVEDNGLFLNMFTALLPMMWT